MVRSLKKLYFYSSSKAVEHRFLSALIWSHSMLDVCSEKEVFLQPLICIRQIAPENMWLSRQLLHCPGGFDYVSVHEETFCHS